MGEMISNAKLFIDFSSTPGGSGGGSLWLQRMSKIKIGDERSVEIKKAIGVRGGAGFIRKQGGGTLSLSEYRQDVPQVRWRRLQKDEKTFTISIQDDAGVRQKWFGCTVSKVDRDLDDEGNHMDDIEIKYLSSEESA